MLALILQFLEIVGEGIVVIILLAHGAVFVVGVSAFVWVFLFLFIRVHAFQAFHIGRMMALAPRLLLFLALLFDLELLCEAVDAPALVSVVAFLGPEHSYILYNKRIRSFFLPHVLVDLHHQRRVLGSDDLPVLLVYLLIVLELFPHDVVPVLNRCPNVLFRSLKELKLHDFVVLEL